MFSAIRTWLWPSSLRTRLTLWYLLFLGGALASLAVFVFVARARALHRELDVELEVLAHQFAAERTPLLLGLDVARALAGDPRSAAAPIAVRQSSGSVLFRSEAFPSLDWAAERAAAAAARERKPLVTASDRSGVSLRIASLVVHRPGADDLVVQVAASTATVRGALRQLALGMTLFILIMLAAASYGGGFIARRALAPVDEIVARVRVQAERLGDRLELRAGSDELDRLVATLNEMLDRIEASVRSARRFAADASHELQTPVAAMRAAVEACLRAEHPSADYRLMAADMLAEIERLSGLVRDLRLLALADRGQLLEKPEPVDLARLTTECCEIARAMAEEKQIQVEALIRERPVTMGSPRHLRRVVLNLVQNAIRYSPVSSRIVLSVDRARDHAMLAVLDHGCGIAAADMPHIFEPFYRADPARARDTGGTGLGLAIVDQIVRVHRGRIKVSSTPGRGSTFVLFLPAAPEDSRPV